ncbi:MAG: DNA polymerase III subunit, partial [Oligoflexia bacterium]|nr:DNA polymerase III subunit [Oligoflexia bacterium]
MAQLLNHICGHQLPLIKLLKAKQDRHLPHALLFSGPAGIGKKKVALALAQTLLCEKSYPACGECDDCINTEYENSQHVLFIQPDGLYIKSESIRQISKFISLQSFAPARVIIIDPADRMNLSSANSLLKILEEPPPNVYFILISSHLSALPVTIRSRVQILRFQPLKMEDLYTIIERNQKEKLEQKEPGKKKKDKKNEKGTLFSPLENHWMIRASHGSMNNLEKWWENKELRDQALKLLKESIT